MKAYKLLSALLNVAEKGATIARNIRSEASLLELLVQEKKGDQKNERFVQDFKTLADVLVQELVKFDLRTKFPGFAGSIYGEESNKFTNTLGDSVVVEIQDCPEKTQALLKQVLDDNDAAAAILSQLIHCHMLDIDPGFADQLDLDLPVDDLGVWIDPIDSTAQYIQGDVGTEEGGLVSEGLQCVAVLVGVYSKTSGLPIIGVINQPFATRDDAGNWKGNTVWGVSVKDVNINSFMAGSTITSQSSTLPGTTPDSNHKPTILISSSESQDITDILSQKFTLREVAGAGYKLLGVCEKLGAGYLLTKSSNYKWDCCGPHAVLLSLGGGILSYEKFEQMCTSSASNESNHFDIQSLPQIVYNRPDQEEATGAQRWCNVGGIVAYSDPTLLNEVASLLKNRQK